jgi:ankyrin repeat protein
MTPDLYLQQLKVLVTKNDFALTKGLISVESRLEEIEEEFDTSLIKLLIDSEFSLSQKEYVLKRLLIKGLNPNIIGSFSFQDNQDEKFPLTIIDYIVFNSWGNSASGLLEITLPYIDKATLNNNAANFCSAIYRAVGTRQNLLIILLLQHGADPNAIVGSNGYNIFDYALDIKNADILKLLLDHSDLKTDFTIEAAVRLFNLSRYYPNLSKTEHFKTYFRLNPIQGLKEELAYKAIEMNDSSLLKKVLGEKWQLHFTSNFLNALVNKIGDNKSKELIKEEIEGFVVRHKDAGLKLIELLNRNQFKEAAKYIKYIDWLNVKSPELSNTPLILTIIKEQSYLAKALLDNGADPNIKGQFIPLLYAAEHGLTDIVELLLEYGAFANAQERNGDTALILGAKHIDIVKALLEYGADPSLQNELERTASDVANIQKKWIERIGVQTGKSGKWADREVEGEKKNIEEIEASV